MSIYRQGLLATLLLLPALSSAGTYTATKNKACPDAWAATDSSIPIVYKTTEENRPPWGVAPSTDKVDAQTHISSSHALVTTDGTNLTESNFEDDLLTIASECLMYRNFEADSWNYVAPEPTQLNTASGWMPAVIF